MERVKMYSWFFSSKVKTSYYTLKMSSLIEACINNGEIVAFNDTLFPQPTTSVKFYREIITQRGHFGLPNYLYNLSNEAYFPVYY